METTRSQTTIDGYIAAHPKEVRDILERIRLIVKEAAPDAKEAISYGMPTFRLNGNLLHFAAHKGHIGFYPTPSPIEAFKEELSAYKHAKGSIQFPLDKPMPYDLIKRIVESRVKENLSK